MTRKKSTPTDNRGARQRTRLIIGLAAAALAIAVLLYFSSQDGQQPGAEAGSTSQPIAELMQPGPLPEKTLGSQDAPVTIVEYSSATCPHCARFHQNILPELKEQYVETGKVFYVMREFPLDDLAMAAFMVARCMEGDRYYAFLELLYARQQEWAFGEGSAAERLFDVARQAGFTRDRFNECLQDQEVLQGIADVRDRAASQFDVNSTPTFFVNGTVLRGPRGVEDFEALMPADVTG